MINLQVPDHQTSCPALTVVGGYKNNSPNSHQATGPIAVYLFAIIADISMG